MAFVTRTNSQLLLNGSNFHFGGCNIPFLGLVQNPYPNNNDVRYPTLYEITDALLTAKEMGATVVRAHTLGISHGHQLAIWPTLNNTNPKAFYPIDFAIYFAGTLGIKLIIPLTDDHYYFNGGKHNFTDWRGVAESTFYTDSNVLLDFQTYIGVILNRVNQYSGLLYKNDPTILAWETGNEIGTGPGTPTSTWTGSIATYIKTTQQAQQLILDGNILYDSASLALTNVDMYAHHYYPPNVSKIQSDATTVSAANKVYIVGEWDWTNNVGGTCTASIDTTTTPPTGGGSNTLKAIVTAAATQNYFDQVRQTGLSLTATHVYTVSFYAKALVGYTIQVQVQQNSGNFTVYGTQNFTLTTGWVQYSFSFTASATDAAAALNFNIGLSATTTWFDLVSLTDNAAPGTQLLTNPSFESSSSLITPWTVNNRSIDTQAAFVAAIEAAQSNSQNIAGDLWWSLSIHNDRTNFTEIIEKYSLRYPGVASAYVTTSDMSARAQVLRTHMDAMSGITPAHTPVAVLAPTITSIYVSPTGNSLIWRGVSGALSYEIASSTTQNGTYTSVTTGLTDTSSPYIDTAGTSTTWYQIRAYNNASVAGPYSVATPIGRAVSVTTFKDGVTL